jgi:hypothetical protein
MFRSLLAVATSLVLATTALAQPTAFTYQGELKSGDQPASGLHDLRFKLFDAATGGTQVGTTLCANNVPVADGRFTTLIDFGPALVTAAARFLEIEVRADTGLDCSDAGGFVTLSPRQALTAAPLASHSRTAFSLAAADGSPSNAVTVDNNGLVGIGTTAPTHSVHIANAIPTLALQDTDSSGTSGGQQAGYISYRDSGNVERGWVGYGNVLNPDFSVVNARFSGDVNIMAFGSFGNVNLVPGPGGRVGVGTTTPTATLDVRGDIRLGSSGQFHATAGEEVLRIVRGTIAPNGTIVRGSGFTVSGSSGSYIVTFNVPFAGQPTVTASGDTLGFPVFCTVSVASDGSAIGISTRDLDGSHTATPQRFHFIAVGPR